jgi:hypothetical protein
MKNMLHLVYEDPIDKKMKTQHFITWRALTSYIWDNKIHECQVSNDAGDAIVRVRYIPTRDKYKLELYSGFTIPASFISQFI